MSSLQIYDVAVIGAGPAGMAAALSAEKQGASVLLIEREAYLGGILKQCIHDGFGLVRFKKKLAGPEYAQIFIDLLQNSNVEILTLTFATSIKKTNKGFQLILVTNQGLRKIHAKALILSTGCRERTARQIAVHGTRPAGVYTAGAAQYYVNILGQLPGKRCVVLGSGDIGLIMARRLTLEGAKVLGVYEAKSSPSGLARNVAQCLNDFLIPLYTSKTVTRVFGEKRLEAVEIAAVDEKMQPIEGTQEKVICDTLILSVGLIPENELPEALQVPLDNLTKGPVCDQSYSTLQQGVYVCGNALHVNDLVDYVSESGEKAGEAAAQYSKGLCGCIKQQSAVIQPDETLLYVVPQRINLDIDREQTVLFFRTKEERGAADLNVYAEDTLVFTKRYRSLRPPEMERITLDLSKVQLKPSSRIKIGLSEVL